MGLAQKKGCWLAVTIWAVVAVVDDDDVREVNVI